MLTIRNAQIAVLVDDRVRGLRAWLLPHLRAHFAERLSGMSDGELRALIENSVARARALGATRSASIGRFVHLRVIFGDRLEALPWAARALTQPKITAEGRIELLARRARVALRGKRAPS